MEKGQVACTHLLHTWVKVERALACMKEDQKSTACIISCSRLAAGGFSVFAGVGERTREGNDLYKEMIESVSSRLVLLPLTLSDPINGLIDPWFSHVQA